jgi:hypothetical protein
MSSDNMPPTEHSILPPGASCPAQSALAAGYSAVRTTAVDVMIFAGMEPEQARRAVDLSLGPGASEHVISGPKSGTVCRVFGSA